MSTGYHYHLFLKNLIDCSQPQWCFRASLSLLGSDWPLGIIKEGRRGEGGRWGKDGGSWGSSIGSSSSLCTLLPPGCCWPFTQEPAGAGRDLIEQLPRLCLGFGWWRRRIQHWEVGGEEENRTTTTKKKTPPPTLDDLQMLIAKFFLGLCQARACTGKLWQHWGRPSSYMDTSIM